MLFRMSIVSKREVLALLLVLSILVPANWLPEFTRGLFQLLAIVGIGYLFVWALSGLFRAPRAYQQGKQSTTNREGDGQSD
jgi:hypothetical protein